MLETPQAPSAGRAWLWRPAALVEAALDAFGGIDGLVSNAGFPDWTTFEELADDKLRR